MPTGAIAKQQYEAQGGNITPFGKFGADPLRNRQDLVNRRDGLFAEQNPPFSILFSDVVSGNGNRFRDGILNYYNYKIVGAIIINQIYENNTIDTRDCDN